MKAAIFHEHGGPEKLLYEEYETPQAGPGDAVVRVKACGMNHVDLLLLDGRYPPPGGLPHINGCEVAGVVSEAGAGVSHVKAGDRVIVFPGFACGACEYCLRGERTVCLKYGYLGAARHGGYAEYVKVPAENCLPLSEKISDVDGAAIPLAFLTSWHALFSQAGLQTGETVLVQAGGSGVGSSAIQIAKLVGARVIATVGSEEKADFARALGADAVINYKTKDFVQETRRITGKRGVDVLIEHIGAETFEKSVYCLNRLGRLISIGSHGSHWARMDLRHVYMKNLKIFGTNLGTILELRTILEFLEAGRLRAVVDRTFPLSQAREAVQYLLDRKNKGKVILIP
ncbi:MAG: zinc-binding dehydrogenase [Candidatus Tectomicrobia bacterium]|nr:zinc-binding dehydrogenase [Candidatus Tectomicrobia bacterium]